MNMTRYRISDRMISNAISIVLNDINYISCFCFNSPYNSFDYEAYFNVLRRRILETRKKDVKMAIAILAVAMYIFLPHYKNDTTFDVYKAILGRKDCRSPFRIKETIYEFVRKDGIPKAKKCLRGKTVTFLRLNESRDGGEVLKFRLYKQGE